MTNYKEYLAFNNGEFGAYQEKIMDKIEIEHSDEKKIKDIKKIDLLVFAEPFCPDCRALVAVLQKFESLNENINIKYVTREHNYDLLKSYSDEARIPTIVIDGKAKFVEFPVSFKLKLEESLFTRMQIVHDYRIGKYNKMIVESLINIMK
ncbi:thioredoxin family protein [Oceanivirga miroungae]|uniref:Thiol-disulfide isomerase and thioredoxins n=1 Tax=Oceanivirga miroungae TaxID=1130046 RepID=A0A6I8MCF8_9FUSO|nr:thioredoxin family protein [Oceanivirga miroungae]VWL85918.1 thiol-disulfide isomerase and thioredoxins [Oceanivirga miroungae]